MLRRPHLVLAAVAAASACHRGSPPSGGSPCRIRADPADAIARGALRHYGVGRIRLELPEPEVRRRSRRTPICFGRAVRLAAESLLADARDPESPRAVAEALSPDSPCARASGVATVACFMNRPSSVFGFPGPPPDGLPVPRGAVPERAHWVFALSMPSLSDHVFWSIVEPAAPGDGEFTATSFGFN